MINLIPYSAKKVVKREYWTRVISVWMFLLTLVSVTFLVELIPLRLLTDLLGKSVSSELSGAISAKEELSNIEKTVTDTNTLIKKLSVKSNEVHYSDYVDLIDELSGDSVQVTEMGFVSGNKVSLSGVAKDRETLAGFRNSLEASPSFSAVVLPISNLAKDKDISFTLTLNLEVTKP